MILVRVDRVKGDVIIPSYKDWFVATSFSFKVGRSVKAVDAEGKDIEVGSDGNDQELSIDKTVDSATVYLMHNAMKNRKDASNSRCNIDIHVVQNKGLDENKGGHLKPFQPILQIRIENAIISNWGIDASDDGRPTESISIWYNRAAMKYRATKDGKTFEVHGPLGWDEQTNADFKSDVLLKD